ncbi:hypothetical protein HMI56_005730 [Coelomomyces lativittatus]|nr:hypothetical protein HMI56_005730 [Coelomomyces lativittatus]
MMKAWGELKIYQLKLLTHRKLIQTSTIPHPIIPILHHRVLKHLSNVLQKRGPMRIPELACHVLTYADSKTRQDFAAIPGGVRKLVQMYPAYFQGIASTFDDVKLKNSKVQLIHPVPEMSELGFEENGFDISEEDPWKSSERFKTFVEIAKHWDM